MNQSYSLITALHIAYTLAHSSELRPPPTNTWTYLQAYASTNERLVSEGAKKVGTGNVHAPTWPKMAWSVVDSGTMFAHLVCSLALALPSVAFVTVYYGMALLVSSSVLMLHPLVDFRWLVIFFNSNTTISQQPDSAC